MDSALPAMEGRLRCGVPRQRAHHARRYGDTICFTQGRLSLKSGSEERCRLFLVRFPNRREGWRIQAHGREKASRRDGGRGARGAPGYVSGEGNSVEPVVPRQEGANPCRCRGLRLRDGGTTGVRRSTGRVRVLGSGFAGGEGREATKHEKTRGSQKEAERDGRMSSKQKLNIHEYTNRLNQTLDWVDCGIKQAVTPYLLSLGLSICTWKLLFLEQKE